MSSVRRPGSWLKAAWVAAVLVGAIVFVGDRWTGTSSPAPIAWPGVGAAVVFLLAAKCVMTLLAHRVLHKATGRRDLAFAFYAYNASQVAKYLPGGIWQHASRALIYRRHGIPLRQASWAIGAEAIWLVGSSAVSGALIAASGLVSLGGDLAGPGFLSLAIILVLGLVGSALFAFRWRGRGLGARLEMPAGLLQPDALLVVQCTVLWALMGASLLSLLPAPSPVSIESLLHVSGAFALGYAAGFLAPFAPAGIGVREAAVVAAMMPIAPVETLVSAAILHRLLYCGVDVALAALATFARPAEASDAAL